MTHKMNSRIWDLNLKYTRKSWIKTIKTSGDKYHWRCKRSWWNSSQGLQHLAK